MVDAMLSENGWDRRRRRLLTEYETAALELFAARGFKSVTFEDVAEAARISVRTAYRYFPTKEDALLGFPRRGYMAVVAMIDELDPSPTPLETAWQAMVSMFEDTAPDVGLLTLWRRAALDVPDVVAQARGERLQALKDALTTYCARSLRVDPDRDVRPGLLAGILAGAEISMVEALTRSKLSGPEVLDAADKLMRGLHGVAVEMQ
jgi:AcrR family transcriptional regulator